MAARRASSLLIAVVGAAALLGLFLATSGCFVAAPLESKAALRGGASAEGDAAVTAAVLGAAVASIPEAAHAANQGYAVLQLGWAVFIIGLGPAVLFYIYFNKPELL
mmetsp:Transcript_51512/g.111733  ORF Transcript_51512/g.111733 Transcript_51512/m.111733 type:complete len:107 (-) Transcript_51512:103-423(-)|eukprot:CAMPEP_0170593318 /NCGR_PEP_ID=MMETSP0224-20130122/13383_1 /TAXON_ID=285029 /ORGANISM="Togula jolla, Strain CCCM 725" /LENGTH=106 /DNA_ID=CAMNT_0010917261 /DNA_START=64 /DNA_END=384 /DNA_ORIENTATION=-